MEELAQLNLLMDLFSDKTMGRNKTPGDVGESLFRNLLERSHNSRGEGEWRASPYENTLKTAGAYEETGKTEDLNLGIRSLGLPSSRLRLPKTAIPQLMRFLENQGLGKEEIQSLIVSVSDRDGSLRMDRLMARLQTIKKEGRGGEDRKVIEGKDIPLLGEALLAMGLGAAQVKEVIEKSLNQKGEVALDKLSGSLKGFVPGGSGETLLTSLLERYPIEVNTKAAGKVALDSDMKNMVKDFSQAASQDVQKKVKEEIGQLLREKGVPPQEVKSFLESLSVGYARSLTSRGEGASWGSDKADAEARAKAVMDRVVLRSEPQRADDGWRNRILEILQKEKGLTREILEKGWFQEEALSRLPGGETLKQAEQKWKGIPIEAARISDAKPRSGSDADQRIQGGVKEKSQSDARPIPSFKEALAGDTTAVRTQREVLESGSTHATRSAVALPEPLPKVFDKMVWMIQGGEQKGRILVSPPELGRLDLDLVIRQGHLQAHLSAENPQVKELIEANMGQLKQQLSDLGYVVDRFEVMVGLEERSLAREQGGTSRRGRNRSGRRQETEDTVSGAQAVTPRESTRASSQVDMRV